MGASRAPASRGDRDGRGREAALVPAPGTARSWPSCVAIRRTRSRSSPSSAPTGDAHDAFARRWLHVAAVGGRAWRLTPSGSAAGRGAASTTAELRVRARRPGRAERQLAARVRARSPPPGVKRKSLYFATRRLSGAGPSANFLAGNWNDHPARVAVYGVARGAKRIVVRAGLAARAGQAAAQRRLPRLPAAVDAGRATVRVRSTASATARRSARSRRRSRRASAVGLGGAVRSTSRPGAWPTAATRRAGSSTGSRAPSSP